MTRVQIDTDAATSEALLRMAGWTLSSDRPVEASWIAIPAARCSGIVCRDTLAEGHPHDVDVLLSNPPFRGVRDLADVQPAFTRWGTRTELLFVAAIMQSVAHGGRVGIILPDGMLFSTTKAHRTMRRALIEQSTLTDIISLPPTAFHPYTGVKTSVIIATVAGSTARIRYHTPVDEETRAAGGQRVPTERDLGSMDEWETPVEALGPDLILVAQRYRLVRQPDPVIADPRTLIRQLIHNQQDILASLEAVHKLLERGP